MSRRHWKKLNINDTSKQDIEDRIEELSSLYDTGWHMDHERPDVGTTLAKIFASQMEENVIVVDVVKPAAFEKEIKRLENFGGRIIYPFMTKTITDEGIFADDGRFISYAELKRMTDEEKNEVSHRGKALRAFVGKLKAYLEEHS